MVHKEREGELLISSLQVMLSITDVCHLGSERGITLRSSESSTVSIRIFFAFENTTQYLIA